MNFAFLFLFPLVIYTVPTGLHYSKTQRGRTMLIYDGFKYVINRESQKNVFWRCGKYVRNHCRAGE